jgi:NAD(P)-dependent dehydrogenase (short-subunit alcohol dehydrogenase family)
MLPHDELLHGKHVLVAGAGRGVGKSVLFEMATHGAATYFTDDDPKSVADTMDELQARGFQGRGFVADTSKSADNAGVCTSIEDEGKPIDVFVNIAKSDTGHDLATVFGMNLIGPVDLANRVAAMMIQQKTQGAIVFVTAPQQPIAGDTLGSSASRAALEMVIKELAMSYAPHGIRVNGIALGVVEEDGEHPPIPFPYAPLWECAIPLAYVGRGVAFLASEGFSGHTTGTMVTIDGGLSLHSYMTLYSITP